MFSVTALLGMAQQHWAGGRGPAAEGLCREILQRDPKCAASWALLGLVLAANGQGDGEAGAAMIKKALALAPDQGQYWIDLGDVYQHMSLPEEAIAAYREALKLQPHDDLAKLARHGLAESEAQLRRRTDEAARQPGDNAGQSGRERLEALVAMYRAAVQRKPDQPVAHYQLGETLQRLGEVDQAVACYRRALELKGDFFAVLNNLGMALKDKGQIEDAVECVRQAVESWPEIPSAHSNLVYMLHFHPGLDAEAIYREHVRWNHRHGAVPSDVAPQRRPDAGPTRRLKVAYVSAHFREHPVGRFLAGWFGHQDRAKLEVFCYANSPREDYLTARLKERADRWVQVERDTDEILAERIRSDGIDILVDLTMHMGHNRLLTFVKKPAPVQVTYLAYCSTTGLATMDYRLTDDYLDPAPTPAGQRWHTEQAVRLESYWCYAPGIEAPAVNELPARQHGYVTFASLNDFGKTNRRVLEVWLRLLQRVPKSRLMINACPGLHRERVWRLFEDGGIERNRVEFFGWRPLQDYFLLHHNVDVALDTFPYPGGTTTCDALWMGVPTVSLVGQPAYRRSGLSILLNMGLGDLATFSEEAYLDKAVEVAMDLDRLAQWRQTMRPRMLASKLMDGPSFARDLERAYRSMWEQSAQPTP